jgi:alpha-beta hydrolase superfamily lysophospholipase
MTLRPLMASFTDATLEQIPLRTEDGLELGLSRVVRGHEPKPAVLLTHGLTASTDMFVLPETRNIVEVLLDNGFEPWLFDWRGSCRLPYNTKGPGYTLDDVALYDMPRAVAEVRQRIGDRKLFVVAHCVGALSLGLSMSAGLVPGLAGVVAQGVFLTPKVQLGARLRMTLAEVARPWFSEIPVDFRKVGLRSKYTALFALASIGAECPDPTCQLVQNSAWLSGAKLFVHDNITSVTHDRLVDLVGTCPMWILPHLRKMELAHSVVAWNETDPRYAALPENALDAAHRIDCPLLLLSGSENKLWLDSNKLCTEVLRKRHPGLQADYVEVPGYGHFDAFIGRSANLDVFPRITQWLQERARA